MERTFVMIKPDGVKRRLIGEIISRFEKKGLYLVASKLTEPSEEILRKHYAEHVNKPFFKGMLANFEKSVVFPMVWEGENAVAIARKIIGATKPSEAEMGSIRGDYGLTVGKNIIHGADSLESAKKEIEIWFGSEIPTIFYFDENIIYEK